MLKGDEKLRPESVCVASDARFSPIQLLLIVCVGDVRDGVALTACCVVVSCVIWCGVVGA